MPEDDFELRSIAWSKVFPFLRLFRTFKLAIDTRQMALALACVLICYFFGRVLDRFWLAADSGVIAVPQKGGTEIAAYALSDARAFTRLIEQAQDEHRRRAVAAVVRWTPAENAADAETLLAANPVSSLLANEGHTQQLTEIRALIDERLEQRLSEIDADTEADSAAKNDRKQALRRQADYLRLTLAGRSGDGLLNPLEQAQAVEAFAEKADPEDQRRFRAVIDRQRTLNELEQREPTGPFAGLLKYEMRSFTAAIQGVCAGRWGLAAGALDPEPAMLGSIGSAGKGLLWLVTQRPWYAIVYGIIVLMTFGFFGAAICRYVAVRIAREESLELRAALAFACEKYTSVVAAPLIPIGIFIAAAIVLFIGGLVGAVPVVGELLSGLLYGLALLGGFALALIVLGSVLGHNLMAPTIAVEGSDAFDAVQHAFGYVGQRPWYAGFYAFVLLLYGAVCFVMLRLIAMLLLKITHLFTGAGMGLVSSAQTETFGKLDAIWHMPPWGDLALLPTTAGAPFWGTFRNAPLNWSENVAFVLIAIWIFMIVGLVGAFLVSFYFSGSTQMFFLLRHHVDAVDLDEIYYEEPEPAADDDSGAISASESDAAEETPPPDSSPPG